MRERSKQMAVGAGLAIAIAFLAVQVFTSPLSPDGDLYFHLKCGELISQTGHWLTTDVFTYTEGGRPDESPHSWLSQFLLWEVFHHGGETALRFLHLTCVLGLLALVFTFTFQRTRSRFSAALAVILAFLIQSRLPGLRPVVFAQLLGAILYLYCFQGTLTRRKSILILMVGFVWLQIHASSALWLPSVLLFLVLRAPTEKRPTLLFLGLTSPLLIFLSPFGWHLYPYALTLSKLGHQLGGGEWLSLAPVKLILAKAETWIRFSLEPQDLLTLVGAGFLIRAVYRDRRKPQNWIFPLLFLCLPLFSIRHLAFSFVPIALLMPAIRLTEFLVPLTALLLCFFFRAHGSYFALPSIEKFSDFLSAAGLEGNAFNFHGWGSFLLFKDAPRIKVASDNRTLLHRQYFEKLDALSALPPKLFRNELLNSLPENTDMLILSTRENPLSAELPSKDWWVVYENNSATLAIRRNARNTGNIERVKRYYSQHGITAEETSPLLIENTSLQNPEWFRSQWENNGLGGFPPGGLLVARRAHDERILAARKVDNTSVVGMTPPKGLRPIASQRNPLGLRPIASQWVPSWVPSYSDNYFGRWAIDILPSGKLAVYFLALAVMLIVLFKEFKWTPTLE